jgi:hypothetical protein
LRDKSGIEVLAAASLREAVSLLGL